METQTLITLARDNYRYGPRDVREQVAHNLVHQWYGASVTPADWRDLWMAEGMATYLQAKFAVSRGWDTWSFWRGEFTRNDAYWRDIYGPPGAWFASEFGQRNVHYGGALMLDRLAGQDRGDAVRGRDGRLAAAEPRQRPHRERATSTSWSSAPGRSVTPGPRG